MASTEANGSDVNDVDNEFDIGMIDELFCSGYGVTVVVRV